MKSARKLRARKPVCKIRQYDRYGAMFSLLADHYLIDLIA